MIEITISNADSPEVEVASDLVQVAISDDTIVYERGLARLEIDFTYTDFISGSKSIGNILADRRVSKVAVIVGSVFNVGTLVVGDSSAHGRLMASGDNDLLTAHTYHTEPDYEYVTLTELKVWFETGSPTQGSGTIIIYYS